MSIVSREMTHDPMCPLRDTVKRQAEKIARLEAELAEAQENERRINREREALCRSNDQLRAELAEARREYAERETAYWDDRKAEQRLLEDERAAHERTKADAVALFEKHLASTERQWMARAKAALKEMEDGATVALAKVMAERDAAQADALALNTALYHARCEISRMATTGTGFSCSVVDEIDAALDSTTGRDLAARLPLWRELEKYIRYYGVPGAKSILDRLAALDAAQPTSKGGGK